MRREWKLKSITACLALIFVLTACAATAIRSELLKHGQRNPSLQVLAGNPGLHEGRLFILGGEILSSKVTDKGSVIEALNIPVDSDGVPETGLTPRGRYLAVRNKAEGILDPAVYKKGSYITVAGYFTGVQKAKLDSANYEFTVFEIAQIRLWKNLGINAMPPTPYPYYPNWPPYYRPYGPYYGPSYPYPPYGPYPRPPYGP